MQQTEKFFGVTSHICYLTGVLVAVFVLAGFLRFSFAVASYDTNTTPTADGIVVLTGGKSRIYTGLELLQNNQAQRLFISGVNANISDSVLVRYFSRHSENFACCIDIGRIAKDTTQNAHEAANWVKDQGFKHIIVVTSDYHMPRALLEFSRAMPAIKISPVVAIKIGSVKTAKLDDLSHLKITFKEYVKTIAASLFSPGNRGAEKI